MATQFHKADELGKPQVALLKFPPQLFRRKWAKGNLRDRRLYHRSMVDDNSIHGGWKFHGIKGVKILDMSMCTYCLHNYSTHPG